EEDQEDEPERVQRRQYDAGDSRRPQACASGGGTAGAPQDEVLAVVTGGDQREAGQRAPRDKESPEGNWKLLAKSAHTKDIVFVVQCLDDDAGCQEQQSLEERMRHEVEDGGAHA